MKYDGYTFSQATASLNEPVPTLPPHSVLAICFLNHQMVGGLIKLLFILLLPSFSTFLYFILNIPGYVL